MVKGALAVDAVQYPADVVLHLGIDGGHASGAATPRPEADHAHLDDSGVVMSRHHLTHQHSPSHRQSGHGGNNDVHLEHERGPAVPRAAVARLAAGTQLSVP